MKKSILHYGINPLLLTRSRKVQLQKEQEERQAQAKKEQEERTAQSNALKNMKKKYDDVKGLTWYRDKSSPAFVNSRTAIYTYFASSNDQVSNLRLVIQYTADDWLFVERYIIKADDQSFTITEKEYGEIETDNGNGGIWEWIDRPVSNEETSIINAIINSKSAKIRFEGKQYYKDKTITQSEKNALKNVMSAYKSLGGSI